MNDNNKMLERVLLMMKYDSSKTLRENSDVVKSEFAKQLNEAPKIKFRAPKPKLSATKTKVSTPKITPSGLSVSQIKSQVATYAKTPLSNGKLPTPAQQVAYGKQLAAGKAAPIASTGKAAPKATTTTTTTTTTTGGGKTGGGRGRPRKPLTPKDKSILSRIGNSIKNNKGKWALAIAGLGLTTAAIYHYLQPKVSPCLLNSLTEEELASLGEAGTTGTIARKEIGNRFADKNGGLTFGLDNTTVTTGNGQYKGSYSCDGNGIKVSIAGMDFVIGGGGTDKGTSGGNGGGGTSGGGGGRYKQCAETFPIAMYCKNSTVARVQGCIGATQDGAFGPNTSAALVAKGADGSSITQATIDKVCGGGQPGKQSAPGSDAEEDDAGGGNTMTVKSNSPMASDDADEA